MKSSAEAAIKVRMQKILDENLILSFPSLKLSMRKIKVVITVLVMVMSVGGSETICLVATNPMDLLSH